MFCGGGRERELKVFCVSGGFLLRFCVSGGSCAAFFRVSALAPPRTSSRAGATDAEEEWGRRGARAERGARGNRYGENVAKYKFSDITAEGCFAKKRVATFKDVQTCFAERREVRESEKFSAFLGVCFYET